ASKRGSSRPRSQMPRCRPGRGAGPLLRIRVGSRAAIRTEPSVWERKSMRPETKYARSGDVNIAYQVVGKGPLDLVYVPGFVSNLENYWDEPRNAHFLERLAAFSRLIWFDKRGTGLS